MAEASEHDEYMKNFMGTEIFMPGVKNWQLQGIDDSAYGVDNSSCEKPVEACPGKSLENRDKGKYTKPAHTDIEDGRQPFRAVDPESFQDNT